MNKNAKSFDMTAFAQIEEAERDMEEINTKVSEIDPFEPVYTFEPGLIFKNQLGFRKISENQHVIELLLNNVDFFCKQEVGYSVTSQRHTIDGAQWYLKVSIAHSKEDSSTKQLSIYLYRDNCKMSATCAIELVVHNMIGKPNTTFYTLETKFKANVSDRWGCKAVLPIAELLDEGNGWVKNNKLYLYETLYIMDN